MMRPVRESFKEKQPTRELNVALGPNSVSVQKYYCLDLAVRGCPFFCNSKAWCAEEYSQNIARSLCTSSIPLQSLYHWSQPDHPKAMFLGFPDLTPRRIPFTALPFGVCYAVHFHGGTSKRQSCKRVTW